MQKVDFKQGHHLDVTTLNFIQDAYTKSIEYLIDTTVEKNFIACGMDFTFNEENITIADGAVVLNGELMPFKGGSVAIGKLDSVYVVKKYDKSLPNENAGGGVEYPFTITFAEISQAYSEESVPLNDLLQREMVHFVKIPNRYRQSISTLLTVSTLKELKSYGFKSTDSAIPTYSIINNHVLIHGVFSFPQNYTGTLGTIPGWTGEVVNGIKCTIVVEEQPVGSTQSTRFEYKGTAHVAVDGELVFDQMKDYINVVSSTESPKAIIFDETPYMLLNVYNRLG